MKKFFIIFGIIIVALIIILAGGPLFVVQEGRQAVIIRFGKIIRVETDAGLKVKTPFVDRVRKYTKRIQSWDGEAQRLPTAENQFIWVDTTARWLINDAKKFYESVQTVEQAHSRLDDVIDSEVRKIISRNSLREAVRDSNVINAIERRDVYQTTTTEEESVEMPVSLTMYTETKYEDIEKGRSELSDEMLAEAKKVTPQYGITLIDIVVRQIKYSDDLTESVYNRMIKERNQIAQAFRSDGEGKKAVWVGKMEKERRSIQSGAYREAESIKGEADARAAAIYAEAYRKNPEFYAFWKSVESYRKMLPKFNKTLTTEPDYFNYLYNFQGRR
ncbi:MAG: membrane protease HflC [Spirochaetes bacterium DG_61]|jgi:membrane protease subunit HflC|nr:MAG: membrane protease HflC [Spirochaetes bacterium DG_61]